MVSILSTKIKECLREGPTGGKEADDTETQSRLKERRARP